jgi:lipopolysaccharide transport system permease protein
MADNNVSVIKPGSSWQFVDFKELKDYRDLFYFLIWRDIKALYAQTILGLLWALLLPVIQIVIFTVVFGKVAKIPTDSIPYVLFSTVAIVPWTYINQAMAMSSQSLLSNRAMLEKIYFPRIIYPITPVLARLLDFFIAMVIVVGVAIYYEIEPTWRLVLFPLFTVYMAMVAAGTGFWGAAMAIRYRDVKHAMRFIIRMLMYSAPIVYSASSIPEKYRLLYSLNPIVGVIEGFRACILGLPMPWMNILPGIAIALILFVSGAFYFKRMESVFVDVI